MIDKDKLLELLEDELGVETDGLEDDAALFSSGLVDSFALVTLMMHIEQTGGFRINPSEVTLDNFDTMARILAFAQAQATAQAS